jgi:hypothetical protein
MKVWKNPLPIPSTVKLGFSDGLFLQALTMRFIPTVTTLMLVCLAGLARPTIADDWLAAPSYFTHNPQTGLRVAQFAPKKPAMLFTDSNRTQSGIRHVRSSIQAGGSAQHTHIVERWGNQPVRPYGE